MTGTELGEKLLESVRQMKAGKIAHVTRMEDSVTMAATARKSLGMSQTDFAHLLGVSTRTLQEWEQGRRSPTGAARTLLKIAAKNPEAVLEAA
jgi:putative transcriptional regulator